jgi:hypothetical protein
MAPSAEQWIEAFAAAVAQPPASESEMATVLKLASVAAHASERRAGPIACWLAANSDIPLDEALVLAQELSGGPDPDAGDEATGGEGGEEAADETSGGAGAEGGSRA